MGTQVAPSDLIALFARNVRARRLELGLTQAQLAERLDVYVPYISAVENGKRTPFLGNIANFAEALETTPDELLRSA